MILKFLHPFYFVAVYSIHVQKVLPDSRQSRIERGSRTIVFFFKELYHTEIVAQPHVIVLPMLNGTACAIEFFSLICQILSKLKIFYQNLKLKFLFHSGMPQIYIENILNSV